MLDKLIVAISWSPHFSLKRNEKERTSITARISFLIKKISYAINERAKNLLYINKKWLNFIIIIIIFCIIIMEQSFDWIWQTSNDRHRIILLWSVILDRRVETQYFPSWRSPFLFHFVFHILLHSTRRIRWR